jgi:uncharacterized protein (UPF0218 family)
MSGLIWYGLQNLGSILTAAGVTWTADARAVRPNIAVIDPPTVRVINDNMYELTFPVYAVVAPPGDINSIAGMYKTADDIIKAAPSTTSGATPTVYVSGGQELPAMQVQTTITVLRVPDPPAPQETTPEPEGEE